MTFSIVQNFKEKRNKARFFGVIMRKIERKSSTESETIDKSGQHNMNDDEYESQ